MIVYRRFLVYIELYRIYIEVCATVTVAMKIIGPRKIYITDIYLVTKFYRYTET